MISYSKTNHIPDANYNPPLNHKNDSSQYSKIDKVNQGGPQEKEQIELECSNLRLSAQALQKN